MGNSVLRREDPDLLTGAARFVADLALRLSFVRSTTAHARIDAVDCAEARAVARVARAPAMQGQAATMLSLGTSLQSPIAVNSAPRWLWLSSGRLLKSWGQPGAALSGRG